MYAYKFPCNYSYCFMLYICFHFSFHVSELFFFNCSLSAWDEALGITQPPPQIPHRHHGLHTATTDSIPPSDSFSHCALILMPSFSLCKYWIFLCLLFSSSFKIIIIIALANSILPFLLFVNGVTVSFAIGFTEFLLYLTNLLRCIITVLCHPPLKRQTRHF